MYLSSFMCIHVHVPYTWSYIAMRPKAFLVKLTVCRTLLYALNVLIIRKWSKYSNYLKVLRREIIIFHEPCVFLSCSN